jgi:hypothetical protein
MHNTKSLKHIIFILLSFALFNGCSGGNKQNKDSSTPKILSFSGIAVDGYLSGATVCIDNDINGYCDITEPITKTKTDGTFSFDKIDTVGKSLLPIIVTGGIDSATQKDFNSTLKTIFNTKVYKSGEVVTVSPLTDLIATLYLKSTVKDAKTLENIIQNIISTLNLSKTDIFSNPMKNPKLFSKCMEVQQIKKVLKILLIHISTLTQQQIENAVMKALTKQIDTRNDLNNTEILTTLEDTLNITVVNNKKEFILAQLQAIIRSLQSLDSKEIAKEELLTRIEIELTKIDVSITDKVLNTPNDETIVIIPVDKITNLIEGHPSIPSDATILDDINITMSINTTTRINTGIEHTSNVEIYSLPKLGTAEVFLVGGEFWNIDYTTESCQTAQDTFIIKKDANEYATVNINIIGFNNMNESNRTLITKEDLPLYEQNLSSLAPVNIKIYPEHGHVYPHYDDANVSKFNYYPNKNFSGIDSFEYNVTQTLNECVTNQTITVTINIEPTPELNVSTLFPDDSGTCKVALFDGNNSLTYTDDDIYGAYCLYTHKFFYKVNNKFLYQKGSNQLHSVHQDGSILDLNNNKKTNEIYVSNYENWIPYVHKGYYRNNIGDYSYVENFIFAAFTSANDDNLDTDNLSFGLLPWVSFNGTNQLDQLFDFVGDDVDKDELVTTSFAEINDNIYFLGHDNQNGNGTSLACAGANTPISADCQGIQLYLNDFDNNARNTALIFNNGNIVSVLNKTLLISYTYGINDTEFDGPQTKLFISDGKIDYFDDETINKHVKLISDNEYVTLELQKAENSYTVFYKGKNLSTNKTEIGFIEEKEPNGISNIRYLKPDHFMLSYICDGDSTDDACNKGLLNSDFNLKKLVEVTELDNDFSELLALDNTHIYFTDYNSTSNGDVFKVYNKENNTTKVINISFLNSNKTRVVNLSMIGNYIYLLTRTTSVDYPISLWKIDPQTNNAIKIESHTILEKKYIKLSLNAFNHGNSIVYTVISTNPNDENDFNDFSLYSYDAKTDTKKLIQHVSHSLQW